MNCKTCGYRLWNLPTRTCPECGSAFAPSEFEFSPNEVQFVCPAPGCEQVYYGTSATGHLVPAQFDCVKCGRPLRMDEMLLRPADWTREDRTGAELNPWLDRARRGRFKTFFLMIGYGMGQPRRLMRATPADSPLSQAWWYLICALLIELIVAVLPLMPIILIFTLGMIGSGGLIELGFNLSLAGLAVIGFWVIFVLIWGATAQLLLAGAKPAGSIGRTYQALCYTCGPMAGLMIPCIGLYAQPVSAGWWVVSATIALKEAQRVSVLRAVAAVVIWPAIVAGTISGMSLWRTAATNNAIAAISPASPAAHSLTSAIRMSSLTDPQGFAPPHAIQLLDAQNWLKADVFFNGPTLTSGSDVPLAGADLDQYLAAAPQQRQQWHQQAAAAQPPGVIAHRLGDFVFTYHRINVHVPPDPDLWTVIFWPDPAVNPPPGATEDCLVGCVAGTTRQFPAGDLAVELAGQNALRASHNLPPLPDPSTVTHAQPAVAP